MVKKSFHAVLVSFVVFTTIIFSSCDSLWDVDPSVTEVSIQIDTADVFGVQLNVASGNEVLGLPAISTTATVALYNAKDDTLISSQEINFSSLESIETTFKKIKTGTEVYATIKIFGSETANVNILNEAGEPTGERILNVDPAQFSARSKDVKVKKGANNLVTHPNVVFLNTNNQDSKISRTDSFAIGSDSNNGLTSATPVETLEKALDILKVDGKLQSNATIFLLGTLNPPVTDTVIDGDGVIIKRYTDLCEMIYIQEGVNVTMRNITFDGNSLFVKNPEVPYNIGNDGTLHLINTIVKDAQGNGITSNRGALTMEGGAVLNNGNIGIYAAADGSAFLLKDVLLDNNHYGIQVEHNAPGKTELINCTFTNNTIGIQFGYAELYIDSCRITGNETGIFNNSVADPSYCVSLKGKTFISGNGITENGLTKNQNIVWKESDGSKPRGIPITLVGKLEEGSKIGISLCEKRFAHANEVLVVANPCNITKADEGTASGGDDTYAFSSNIPEYTLTDSDMDKFFLDTGGSVMRGADNNSFIANLVIDAYISSNSTGSSTGLTPRSPVKTFAEAQNILANTNEKTIKGDIWVMDTIHVTGDENWIADSANPITLKRYDGGTNAENAFLGDLVNVTGNLTLENITLDGQGGITSTDFTGEGSVVATEPLITVKNGGTLALGLGVVLQNNNITDLLVEGAGIYVSDGARLNLSGNPVVKDNTSLDIKSNISFVPGNIAVTIDGTQYPAKECCITVIDTITHAYNTREIGLSPRNLPTGTLQYDTWFTADVAEGVNCQGYVFFSDNDKTSHSYDAGIKKIDLETITN